MWRDLRFGLRQLTRNKLLSATIVLMLAIGIGANTMIFSFIDSLLLKPLPVRDPQIWFCWKKCARSILYVRTFGNPASIIGETRNLLRRIDPKVPLVEVVTLEQEVQNSLW